MFNPIHAAQTAGKVIIGAKNKALKINKSLSQRRLDICKDCPLYTQRFGGKCNDKLWYNPNTNELSTEEKQGFINGCGCLLKLKTTIKDEKCVLDKW